MREEMSGIDMLVWLQKRHVRVPVVIFTGYEDILDVDFRHRLGVTTIITKGRVSVSEVVNILRRTVIRRESTGQGKRLRARASFWT